MAAINQDLYARVQAQTGWDVQIVLPNRWHNEYGAQIKIEQWPAFEGELTPKPVLLAGNIPLHVYVTRMSRLIPKACPDVIFVDHEPYAIATFQVVWANSRSLRVPIGVRSWQNINKRFPWPFSGGERAVLKRVSFALPATEDVASVLRLKGYRGPMAVLPWGLDMDHYRPDAKGSYRMRSGNGSMLTVGFAGRLVPEKGLETLLEALPSLSPNLVQVMVVGDGPSAADLRQRAHRLGVAARVSWSGYVPHAEMPDAYRSMDLLVVPSRTVTTWHEQFGRVVIEALACGVPVVTSDSGELPNLIEQTGGGWTFAEGDPKSLARLLDRLARNGDGTLREHSIRGRATVERLFGIDVIAQSFADLVSDAVHLE